MHCSENSRIFRDEADQTLPVTEFCEIYNWKIKFSYLSRNIQLQVTFGLLHLGKSGSFCHSVGHKNCLDPRPCSKLDIQVSEARRLPSSGVHIPWIPTHRQEGIQGAYVGNPEEGSLLVPWRLRHPPVGHCDTSTRTIRHCNDSPHVVLRPCDPTSAIRLDSGFFVQGVFVGA
jgi:hypothetical protein